MLKFAYHIRRVGDKYVRKVQLQQHFSREQVSKQRELSFLAANARGDSSFFFDACGERSMWSL